MPTSLILALCLAGQASPAQARREVEDVYRRFARCWEREDVDGLAKMVDPAGSTVRRDGSRWSFGNFRRDLVPLFAARRNGHMSIRIDRFEVFHYEAHVWLTATDRFELKTKSGWKAVKGQGKFYERLTNNGSPWRIIESIELGN